MAEESKGLPLAVVTGAAVRVGRAIAESLVQRGYALGLHYHHSAPAAEELAAQVRSYGGQVLMLPADLTQPEEIEGMFARVAESSFQLKVLVNSAAVMERARLNDLEPEAWDQTLALNLRAPWLCARSAARLMNTGGSIINITDAGASRAWTGYPAYIISKSALETLTRLLARDLAPQIRVNAVAPGLIMPSPEVPQETWERLINRLPLHSAGNPRMVAQAVIFLIESEYITGQTIVVDGGYQIQ